MGITFSEYTKQLHEQQKKQEAAKTASASAVKKKKRDENLYAQAARPAENRTSYADAAGNRRSYFGMGDTALDADQGRELLYSAQKASEERLARATAQIEEQARQARELREQSRKASEERLKRAREQIEAQARQTQEAPAQREATRNVSYTQEDIDRGNRAYAQRQAQQEQARAGFRGSVMDMIGAGLAAQETPYGAAAEQGRQAMDLYARAAESQRQSKELARAEDWEGREDMIARYRDLQRRVQETETMVGMGFGTPEDYEAQVRELEALRTELERRDTLAGNGARSYSGEDRVGNVLTGTGQNIVSGIVNAGATAGEGYAREEALRENIAPSDYVLRQMAKGDLTEWNAMRQRTVDQEAIHEQFMPVYQAADSLSENAQRDLQKAKEGLGALGQAGVDIAENMMEMGFDAAVGAVSGGGSLTSMFVRVFGQSAQEARQNGATLEQQLAYGLTSAGIEILTEKIADGVAGIYGAGAADDITEALIRKLAETDTGRSALRLLIAGISEGGEEVVSELLSPIAQAMYRTDEMGNRLTVGQLYGQIDPADVLHSFIMGAAVGWLSSAGGAVTGSNAAPNAELRLRDALEPMAQQAAKSAETRAAWEAATGEKLSKNEGRAARQMLDYEAERVGSGEAGVLEGLLENENAPAEAEAVERAQNENAPAGTAEAEVSAAQTGAEGAQIENEGAPNENGNAQIENGNAQATEEGGQTAEKPDLNAVRSKAAQGLDKLTDAELQVYTEYMQQQVEQSENSQGYADNLKQALREGLADAQAEAQRRGATTVNAEEGATEKKIKKANSNELIKKLRSSIPALRDMSPVGEATGNEFQKGEKTLTEQVGEFFKSLGNKIFRKGFGDVILNTRGVKSDIAHGIGRAKAATFAVVPQVIEQGRQIDYQPNWEGRGKNSYVFAAPITLEGKKSYVAAVVMQGADNHFYLHEVIDENGNIIYKTEEAPVQVKTEFSSQGERIGNTEASEGNITQTTEESNPQNEGGESQSREAAENGKEEKGSEQAEAVADLSQNQKSAENGTEKETGGSFADAQDDSTQRTAAEDTAAGASGELETRESVEEAKADLLEVGEGKVKNDTGEYRMTIRRKNDGHYLASVDFNGKRSQARTFGTAAEAAEWAAGTVDGQTRARQDAEMDRHKSEKKKGPTLTQQLFGQFDPEAEAKRQKENRAAEAATQTLRSRVKNTQEEINALNRLERTTGLTEAQRSHRADLQQTLEIMNDELESRKKKRGEAKAGERVEVKGNKPTQSVADARRTIMNLFHTPEGVRQEAGAAIQERLEAMLRDGRVDEQGKQTLFGALMEAGMVPKAADPTFRQIREDLNGTRIYVNEQERADIGDNWKDLYQKAWGARIFLTSNPTDVKIDAVNGQMAETYGESMFPADAALSDMLENLIDKANRGRDSQQKLTDAIEDEARYTDTDIDEIYEDMYNRLDSELRTFAEKAGLEVALKNKAAGDMATERKRWEDRMERKAQERRESKIREKVLKGLQKLERLRGKSAPEVRAQIDEVLKDIDTQARSLTPYGIENLQALREVYEEKARQEGFVDDENPGNFIRNPYVEEKIGRLEKMHLNEMEIGDVIELGNTVAGLVHAVQTANQMIGEEFDAGVKETAEAARKEIQASRGARPGFLQKWFAEEQLSPRRFLELLGGWKNGVMKKLAASLENGQTRMLDFQRRAMQSFDPFMSKEENRKWLETASGKNAKWSTYSVVNGMDMEGKSGYTGQTIEITPMMKIALYLHSLNNDNLRHIQTGGLVIPDKALYQKGKIAEAYAQGQKVKMQPEAVRAIASTLTPEEKTFAGYLQKFFNEQSKAAINEVSMQLDGFERAGVDNYFPIETDSSFLRSDVAGEARAATVEGIGSIANERVHAGNPIRLCDASDVLERQIDKVSRYYGYAIPIRNFQAVNNYTFHEEGNAFAGSIKDSMNKKWGSGAQQYITKMLADLQSGGSAKTDMLSRGLAWLRGNLAGATLSVNPSVAVSQTASYPGAAQVVGWDGLAAGLAGGKVDEKLIEKYTPLLWYRSQGYSTQELGDAKAAADKTLGQKALSSKWLNWIQGMDRATVKRLWAAAEYRVTKDTGMKPGSKAQIDAGTDPYYKAVAEVFNRAVYDTQPNYTNMERAQILRSDSQLTKMLTMYKTVPLQYYGMMYEAMGRLRAAQNGTEAEQKAARKYAADTVSGLIAANTLYVAVKAAFKGLRRKDDDYRDDEGELTAESVTKQLGKDLLETTAGSIIGGAEAYSIIDGWFHGKKFSAPDISALSHAEDVINDINNIFKAIDADDPRKTAGAVKTAAETLAMTWGIPVKNAETYLTALIGRAWPKAAMEYNNLFGGIDKSDIKKLDDDTVGMAANIIMRNRTGVQLDRAATDELSRLYKAGYNTAIPTEIPESFSYGGNEVKIKDRGAYGDTWGGVVGDNLEELLTSDSYEKANDKTKAAMVNHLYQYATVQARMGADPEYTAEGNSTYGWTVKADEAVEAGIDLSTAIGALVTMNGMTADKEAGRTVVSKKSKVVDYIDGLDLDEEQKDLLYEMAGYTSGLEYAPWHTGISAEAGYTSGTGPKVHEGTKKEVIAQYSDALTGSAAYKAADDQTKKAMVKLLQDYATAQGMKKTDPSWTPAGTEYNWTTWADTAVKAGIDLSTAIGAKIELGKMKADYDDYGKAITGSKKEKVCAYIDALDLTPEQKDVLYLSVYNENSLRYTPWHGYEKKSGSSRSGSGRRRGGGRSGRRTSSGSTKISAVSARPGRSTGGGIDISKLFGVRSPGKLGGDASRELLEIIDRYYGGDAWAAAIDGGQKAKGRTTIDFKI